MEAPDSSSLGFLRVGRYLSLHDAYRKSHTTRALVGKANSSSLIGQLTMRSMWCERLQSPIRWGFIRWGTLEYRLKF